MTDVTMMVWEVVPDPIVLIWEAEGGDVVALAEQVQAGRVVAVVGPPGSSGPPGPGGEWDITDW